MSDSHTTVRLLPWATPDGNPCFLLGDGTGYVSRLADDVENVQLDMAQDLLGHAADMLGDIKATTDQLRFLSAELTAALRHVLRVAESRNVGLPPADSEPEGHGRDLPTRE
ncbi:hypothetical protein OIU91_25235 [Streptomyces sp. NBC_01456]|uniref:hypothetical protein n=1 Tax=unclassified Streptomyces TaxID=2593676 RepID=UPI002E2F0A5C|nr:MULTISPECIES: hypothetical protein [unclassified Streptomyces]